MKRPGFTAVLLAELNILSLSLLHAHVMWLCNHSDYKIQRVEYYNLISYFTARQCTVCSLVYCTHTNRYSSALNTWAVFHTSRMRRLYTSQNEHFAYTYDIAVCIWIRYIRHHLSAYFRWTRADSVHVMYSNRFKSIFCSAYLKASA